MTKWTILLAGLVFFLQACIKEEPCQTCNVPWYRLVCEKPGAYPFNESGNVAYMITYYEGYTAMGYTCQYIDSGSELHTCNGDQIKYWKGEGYSCHE